MLLCRRHHRAVHEEGFQVERLSEGDLRFRTPHGWVIPDAPEPETVLADAGDSLRAQNVVAGAKVDANSLRHDWDGTGLNLGWAISVMLRVPTEATNYCAIAYVGRRGSAPAITTPVDGSRRATMAPMPHAPISVTWWPSALSSARVAGEIPASTLSWPGL